MAQTEQSEIEPIYFQPVIKELIPSKCKTLRFSTESTRSAAVAYCDVIESIIKVEVKEMTLDDSILGEIEMEKELEKASKKVVESDHGSNRVSETNQKIPSQSMLGDSSETEEDKEARIQKRLMKLAQEIEKRKIFVRPFDPYIQQDMNSLMADGLITKIREERAAFDSRTDSTLNYKLLSHSGNDYVRMYDFANPEMNNKFKLDFKRKTRFISLLIRYLAVLRELDADTFGNLWFFIYRDLKIAFSSDALRDRLILHILSFHQYQLIMGSVHQKGLDGLIETETTYRYIQGTMDTEVRVRNREELPIQELETYNAVIRNAQANLPPISRVRKTVVPKPIRSKIVL